MQLVYERQTDLRHGLGGSIFIAAGGELTFLLDESGELFNAVTFVIFGAAVLESFLDDVTWELVLYALVSLTVVRMVPVALALAGTRARLPTIAFVGWFGPRGLASIVFGVILLDDSNLPHEHLLLLAVTATVGISVLAHGITARPLTERYVGWWNSHPRESQPSMEAVEAAAHRVRGPGRRGGAGH
jgi:NhaP-type Na+/H+ or K+/H+ antiporter